MWSHRKTNPMVRRSHPYARTFTSQATLCSVTVRPWKAGNYLKICNWFVFVLFEWRFVFGIDMRWEGREPFPSRRHHDSGINKTASLLLLSYAKVTPRTCLTGKPARGYSVNPPSHLTNGVDGRTRKKNPLSHLTVGCSSPFMRLAEHLTALRAWCKQCLPGR